MRNRVSSVGRIHWFGILSKPVHFVCLGNILCVSVKRSSAANSSLLNFCWCLCLGRRLEDNVYVCAGVDSFPEQMAKR